MLWAIAQDVVRCLGRGHDDKAERRGTHAPLYVRPHGLHARMRNMHTFDLAISCKMIAELVRRIEAKLVDTPCDEHHLWVLLLQRLQLCLHSVSNVRWSTANCIGSCCNRSLLLAITLTCGCFGTRATARPFGDASISAARAPTIKRSGWRPLRAWSDWYLVQSPLLHGRCGATEGLCWRIAIARDSVRSARDTPRHPRIGMAPWLMLAKHLLEACVSPFVQGLCGLSEKLLLHLLDKVQLPL
mmetsp:Transcript_115038/g.229051  ORF Transcript_115038/g.229051 Transcript_115038/m.229051 type:complete len:243 (-) Transcript_115038:665-1393(-)